MPWNAVASTSAVNGPSASVSYRSPVVRPLHPSPVVRHLTDIEQADANERHHAGEASRWRKRAMELRHYRDHVEPRLAREAGRPCPQADRTKTAWRDGGSRVGK